MSETERLIMDWITCGGRNSHADSLEILEPLAAGVSIELDGFIDFTMVRNRRKLTRKTVCDAARALYRRIASKEVEL